MNCYREIRFGDGGLGVGDGGEWGGLYNMETPRDDEHTYTQIDPNVLGRVALCQVSEIALKLILFTEISVV